MQRAKMVVVVQVMTVLVALSSDQTNFYNFTSLIN